MTLRSRLALLVTVLLAAVLAAAGVVFERLEARHVEATLDRRAADAARTPILTASDVRLRRPRPDRGPFGGRDDRGPAMSSDGAEPKSNESKSSPPDRPPRPPPRDDGPPRPERPDEPDDAPPPPDDPEHGTPPGDTPPPEAEAEPPPSPRPDSEGPRGKGPRPGPDGEPALWTVKELPAPQDGSHVEVLLFEMPRSQSAGEPTLRARAATGTPVVEPAAARALLSIAKSGAVERRTLAGREYVVAAEALLGRGPFDGPPPRPPRGGRGEHGRPPPALPIFFSIAFVDAGPLRAEHAALVQRTAAIGGGALLCGALLAFALAGRMLRPIRTAATAAEAIASPSQRLPLRGSSDELERLIVVLNGMLARLDEAASRERHFLATASHELRRPLTALLGELELAAAPGRDAAALRSSIGLALDDGRAMRRLVEDLLHHARAQAGALRLAESDVLLEDVVADAVARSRRAVGNGSAEGAAHDANGRAASRIEIGSLPSVTLRADPDALRQVLENLLVNGATHGGPEARVTISAALMPSNGHSIATSAPPGQPAASDAMPAGLLIQVDDDGPGIPPHERTRVFEPFGRGDRTRTVPGFGLGLAIARDLVLAHGGEIDAISPLHPDDAARPGTRFTVRWPAERVRGA